MEAGVPADAAQAADPAALAVFGFEHERIAVFETGGGLAERSADDLPAPALELEPEISVVGPLPAEFEAGREQGIGREDLDAVRDSLHSLLGMSGEAGAAVLYRVVRETYVPMAEGGSWPRDSSWLHSIREAADEAQAALKSYGAMHSAFIAVEE